MRLHTCYIPVRQVKLCVLTYKPLEHLDLVFSNILIRNAFSFARSVSHKLMKLKFLPGQIPGQNSNVLFLLNKIAMKSKFAIKRLSIYRRPI